MPPQTRRIGPPEKASDFLRFPLRPAPRPRLLADGSIEWVEWRGSPELLARVVDAAEAALREHSRGSPTCSITVAVKDDREVFDGSRAFRTDVTPEALRDFKSIQIKVFDALADVHVSFVRSFGQGRVRLDVSTRGGESEDVEPLDAVRGKVRAAIDRGRPGRYDVPVFTGLFVTAAVAAVESLRFLLSIGSSAYALATLGIDLMAALLILSVFWVRPNVEVASLGRTRLWRIVKFLGTTLAAIIVAGIVKALFG